MIATCLATKAFRRYSLLFDVAGGTKWSCPSGNHDTKSNIKRTAESQPPVIVLYKKEEEENNGTGGRQIMLKRNAQGEKLENTETVPDLTSFSCCCCFFAINCTHTNPAFNSAQFDCTNVTNARGGSPLAAPRIHDPADRPGWPRVSARAKQDPLDRDVMYAPL